MTTKTKNNNKKKKIGKRRLGGKKEGREGEDLLYRPKPVSPIAELCAFTGPF